MSISKPIHLLIQTVLLFAFTQPLIASERAQQVLVEKQTIADLGNGFYRNPIIAGRRADPSLVRIGQDYYMTHGGGGSKTLLFWHSRDLVNWRPVHRLKLVDIGYPWAPDLVFVNNKYNVYFTSLDIKEDGQRVFANYVYTATKITGPWQGPFNLDVAGLIDPGHIIGQDGKRYLYFAKGWAIELSADGTKRISELKKYYDGWKYPDSWIVECPCLESPKFFFKDGYYYLVSAMGGTSGPSTSHMAVVARSKQATGPWENSPYNPLIRTKSRKERWWSQGHATLLDAIDGSWWAIYHGYENGYLTLSRQTLMLPIEWTSDGWPKVKDDVMSDQLIPMPPGKNIGHGMPLSDDFNSNKLGLQWKFYRSRNADSQWRLSKKRLFIRDGDSNNPRASTGMGCSPFNHAYEISVKVSRGSAKEAGIFLSRQGRNATGVALGTDKLEFYWRGEPARYPASEIVPWKKDEAYLKILNLHHDVAIFYSEDGKNWTKFVRGFDVHGRSLVEPTLMVRSGEASFDNFVYQGLE